MKSKILFTTLLVAFLFIGQMAFSATTSDVNNVVERANSVIESLVNSAIYAVSRLDENSENYDEVVQAIGEALVRATSRISEAVIKYAEKQGVTVVCYDVEVVLGDQTFIIDPLRVIDD
ncbi:hypothetical protein AT15_01260 [Kosmotoga arenicorallina S304]|uniref:Uncharacterized protein n=1 Tax=Kosmotoga arenicorallina S304 TaxID=1453497 RepID=A0A176K0M4_9BACT|nr:hypothetical protein [Kosmotoga arenicorallina]OAA29934.1 hypothetical protein AT15_01260 [Kosmotoga arenicorallina S304]